MADDAKNDVVQEKKEPVVEAKTDAIVEKDSKPQPVTENNGDKQVIKEEI